MHDAKFHLMQSMLNTSKEMMLNMLARIPLQPGDYMIQSTKITLSHLVRGWGGSKFTYEYETLQCFKASICLFEKAETNKLSHLHYHTVQLYNLISSTERLCHINKSYKTQSTWSPYHCYSVTKSVVNNNEFSFNVKQQQ